MPLQWLKGGDMNKNIKLPEARKQAAYWSTLAANNDTVREPSFQLYIMEQVSFFRSIILTRTMKRAVVATLTAFCLFGCTTRGEKYEDKPNQVIRCDDGKSYYKTIDWNFTEPFSAYKLVVDGKQYIVATNPAGGGIAIIEHKP